MTNFIPLLKQFTLILVLSVMSLNVAQAVVPAGKQVTGTIMLQGGSNSAIKWSAPSTMSYKVHVLVPKTGTTTNALYRVYPKGKKAGSTLCDSTNAKYPCFEVTIDQTQHQNAWVQLMLNEDAATQWDFSKGKGYVTAVADNLSGAETLNLSAAVRFSSVSVNPTPLFQDDFSGTLSAWSLNPASGASFAIVNGELVQSNTSPGIPYNDLYVPTGFDWQDYEVSFKARHVSGFYSVTALGITIRRQQDSNSNGAAGYRIELHGNGFVQLHKLDGAGGAVLLQASSPGTLPVPNSIGYQVQVRALGDWIQVWVDGIKYIDVHDATYSTGTIGLESVHVAGGFDDVTVVPISAIP